MKTSEFERAMTGALDAYDAAFKALQPMAEQPVEKIVEFTSDVYDLIEKCSSRDSPHSKHACSILASDASPADKASAILGVFRSLIGYDNFVYLPVDEKALNERLSRTAHIIQHWFIAFGAGAIFLLVSEESLLPKIREAGDTYIIGSLFFGGLILQVLNAIIDNLTAWYEGEYLFVPDREATWAMRFSLWFKNAMWLKVTVDILTLSGFSLAVLLTMRSLTQ